MLSLSPAIDKSRDDMVDPATKPSKLKIYLAEAIKKRFHLNHIKIISYFLFIFWHAI